MNTIKALVIWLLEHISPSTVESAIGFAHKAIEALERAEQKALDKTSKIDAQVAALTADKARFATTAEQAGRVAGNLRTLVA